MGRMCIDLAEGDGLVLDGGAEITFLKKSGGRTRILVDPQDGTKVILTRNQTSERTEPPESQ